MQTGMVIPVCIVQHLNIEQFKQYYVFSFDCSCLFADRLSLLSKFICGMIGYFVLVISMWY